MLKKIIAVLVTAATLMSYTGVFASDEGVKVAPNEQPYGTKYAYHPLLNMWTDNQLRASKLANPDNYAMHISDTLAYSGSKSLYMDVCNHWWKQFFHSNYCKMTEANSNINSGDLHYVNPSEKNVEFSMKLAGDFSHMPSNAGLLDTGGIKVKFSDMAVKVETIDNVTWRTYSYSGKWPGTGWIMGIGGTHACGAYIDDMYLKVGDVVVINDNFEDDVNTDIRTVDAVKAEVNGEAVRISWRNPYFSDLTKIDIYDVTNGANTSILSLTSADATAAPGVVFTQNTDCYFDVADAAASSKKYKIVTSTANYADVETTVDYTYVEKTEDDKPYGNLWLNSKYFEFIGDSDFDEGKLLNPGEHAAHISDENSYSGDKALYMHCCNRWWKQYFHTDYGCKLSASNATTSPGAGTYYINPNGKTIDFSIKIGGDFSHTIPNAGLCDTSGLKVKFSEMTVSAIETIDGMEWRTYTWNGTWPGTGWILGMSGTHACMTYFDDIKLKVNNTVVFEEDFETSVNTDISTIDYTNVSPVNDTTLRIGWVNPKLSNLTKLEIYDITDGSNTQLVSLTAADTTVAPNVSFNAGKKCLYDVTGLVAETYKKYKIVIATAAFGEKEVIVDGRTMKESYNIVNNNYDDKGFSFGGSWVTQVGDGVDGVQGEWKVDFDNVRTGQASFKIEHYGTEARLLYYFGSGRTLYAGTPYTFNAFVKTGDDMPAGKASLFLTTTGGGVVYATSLGTIKSGDWQKLTYTVTPTEDTLVTLLKFCFYTDYATDIYIDDIYMGAEGDTFINAGLTEQGLEMDNAILNVVGGQKTLSWRYTLNDLNAKDTVGFNVYHVAKDGTETKLNDSMVKVLDEAQTTLSYNIDNLLPGSYEIRTVTSLGFEGGAISIPVDDIGISEGTFKTVYWNEGFNQYGENFDEGMSYDADMLTSYGDTLGTITITNYSEDYQNGLPVCLIGALYKDGALVNVVKNPITTVAYGDIASLSVAFETTAISDLTGYEMKLFLWDSINGMKPIAEGSPASISGPEAN